jgi:hypothetical protein
MSSAVILGMTALAKLVTILHGTPALELYDPVFPFSTIKSLIFVTAIVEFTVMAVILLSRDVTLGLIATEVLAGCFLTYRATLYLGTGHLFAARCHCFGYVGDWLGLSPLAETLLSLSASCYLLIGSSICVLSLYPKPPSHEQQNSTLYH